MTFRVFLRFIPVLAIVYAARADARNFVVDQRHPRAGDSSAGTDDSPFKTIARAASVAKAGDTVIVREGLYRESGVLENSGTAAKPIEFVAEPSGKVVVTGADVLTGFRAVDDMPGVYAAPWNHVFAIDTDDKGRAIEFHPDGEPLWGRAEQVIVDDHLLLPVKDSKTLMDTKGPPVSPIAHLGGPFAGWFCVDSSRKLLFLKLADGSEPAKHRVEASTRDLLFGTTPFENEQGVSNIHVRGFVFRDAATFPQRAGVWLHGKDNLLEDCIVERMAGTGASVSGTMRNCIVRNNGHTGGGASSDGFLNEHCTWEGNSWKPISRGWEAGGMKIADQDGGTYRRCTFRRNGGPGLWLDVNMRNVLITECQFIENETSGLFIEISQNIRAINNLAYRNGIDVIGKLDDDAWSVAGIQIAESMNCEIRNNTCVENRDGIGVREQGPREIDSGAGVIKFHNAGVVISHNVLASNRDYQLGLWYDSNVYTIARNELKVSANLFDPPTGGAIVSYGAPWREASRKLSTLTQLREVGLHGSSTIASPQFVEPGADFRFKQSSAAIGMDAGWQGADPLRTTPTTKPVSQ